MLEKLKGRDHPEDLGVDVSIVLESVLGYWSGTLWTGFIWLRKVTVVCLL